MNRADLLPRFACAAVLMLCLAAAAGAQTEGVMDMSGMQGGAPPADARDPHAYAEGVSFTRGERRPRLADTRRFGQLLIDNLEVQRANGETFVPYDVEGWFGGNYERLVLKAEGEVESGDLEDARTELLWGHAVSAFWDTQVGVRRDGGVGPSRTWVAAGVEGLAPYWFDLEITAYIGESSRTAFRVDASYDMLITQRLILQPRLELNAYGEDDPERGLGSGLADATLALRLRHEFRREFAPYVGLEWVNQYGGTEALSRAAGRDPSDIRLMIGLRFWF